MIPTDFSVSACIGLEETRINILRGRSCYGNRVQHGSVGGLLLHGPSKALGFRACRRSNSETCTFELDISIRQFLMSALAFSCIGARLGRLDICRTQRHRPR